MKCLALVLCVLLGSTVAAPPQVSRTSVLDIFGLLEKIVENEGHAILEKVVTLIHRIQEALFELKDAVPKEYEKIHQEVDEVLAGLRKVYGEIEELFHKKDVAYGFELLDGLTELTGGTKLSTILSLLSLADKAHRVLNDAKEFVPHLEKILTKIQAKLEVSVMDLAHHVIKEMGLHEMIALSVTSKIENLVEQVEEEIQHLILDLLHQMEKTFTLMKDELPEVYVALEHRVEEVRQGIHDIIQDIEKSLNIGGYSLLDLAGNLTGGTSLSTVFKVMSLIDKFNTCVQDVKNFGPRAERLLEHSIQKVADRAQDFFSHTADLLMQSPRV